MANKSQIQLDLEVKIAQDYQDDYQKLAEMFKVDPIAAGKFLAGIDARKAAKVAEQLEGYKTEQDNVKDDRKVATNALKASLQLAVNKLWLDDFSEKASKLYHIPLWTMQAQADNDLSPPAQIEWADLYVLHAQ